MCLSRVDNHDLPLLKRILNLPRDPSVEGTGYKVLRRDSDTGDLTFPYRRKDHPQGVVEGKWMVAVPNALTSDRGQHYESGFHIYEEPPTLSDFDKLVMEYIVVRVRYRSVTCTGIDFSQRTVVAREMLVLTGKEAGTDVPGQGK